MRKSVKRFYEIDRTYDYCDFNTKTGKKLNKKRAHRRLRKQEVLLKEEDYASLAQ